MTTDGTPTGTTVTYLHSFDYSDGENPVAPLIEDSSANLYGTTYGGGNGGFGTAFQITSDGQFSTLHHFSHFLPNGLLDGNHPAAALVQDQDDTCFYGTTYQGGSWGAGIIFRIKAAGSKSRITRSPESLDFGEQVVGTTSPPQTVVVTNIGCGAVNILNISVSGPFARGNNTCSDQPLYMRETCTIDVTFSPSELGPASGNLIIVSDADDHPTVQVQLSGNGVNLTGSRD